MTKDFTVSVDAPDGTEAERLLQAVLDIGWEDIADRFDDPGWQDDHPPLVAAHLDGDLQRAVAFAVSGSAFRTATAQVIGERRAVAAAGEWVARSQWFEVMPLPFDVYEFSVKREASAEFHALVADLYAKHPLAPGEGEDTEEEDE